MKQALRKFSLACGHVPTPRGPARRAWRAATPPASGLLPTKRPALLRPSPFLAPTRLFHGQHRELRRPWVASRSSATRQPRANPTKKDDDDESSSAAGSAVARRRRGRAARHPGQRGAASPGVGTQSTAHRAQQGHHAHPHPQGGAEPPLPPRRGSGRRQRPSRLRAVAARATPYCWTVQ